MRSYPKSGRGLSSPSSSAFTLVELLIGASLSAAVLAAVLSSYIFLGRQLGRLTNQQTLETQARLAIGVFTQDVQNATGLATISISPTSPAANRVDLTLATATGTTNTITYYYNSNLTATASVTVNGTLVTMPAASLTRCVYDGDTVTSRTLVRYITDGDTDATDNDLQFRFYDSNGREYTTYTNYLPGIKQVSLEYRAQVATTNNGTSTSVQRETSSRLALRNKGYLQ
jgi:Tfp pilus assembly protein PilW